MIKHNFVNPKTDNPTFTGTKPSHWNAEHDAVWTGLGYSPDLFHILGELASTGWIKYENVSGYNGVTDAGGGTINVDAGEGLIRSSDSSVATLTPCGWIAASGLSIPINTTRYVVVQYNAGSPAVALSTSFPTDFNTNIYLAEVHNIAGVLNIHNDPRPIGDISGRVLKYIAELLDKRVVSGEIVSDPTPPSRKIKITAGVFWDRFLRRLTTALFDTSGTDTMTKVYRNGTGEFTRVSGQTQWENTQYDDNTGTPATLPAGYYANIWVIRGFFGNVYYMLGQSAYLYVQDALGEEEPIKPEETDEHGFFVARITFQKNAASSYCLRQLKPTVGTKGGLTPPIPSNEVISETTYGMTPDAGSSPDYSRSDHAHGTPAASSTQTKESHITMVAVSTAIGF